MSEPIDGTGLTKITYEFDAGKKIIFHHDHGELWHHSVEWIGEDSQIHRVGIGQAAGDIFFGAVWATYQMYFSHGRLPVFDDCEDDSES
jgi:hypothetical protein